MAEANKKKDPLMNSSTRVSGSYDFWDVLETHMGVEIAPYVKNVLSLSNLDNPLSFRHITEETIDELEKFSRDTVKIILRPEDDKEEFYGLYGRSPGKFKFMIGDRHLISELVKFVKSKSQEFWKSENVAPNVTPNVASNVNQVVASMVTPTVAQRESPRIALRVTPSLAQSVTPRVAPRAAKNVTPTVARRESPRIAQRVTPSLAPNVASMVTPTVTTKVAQRVTPRVVSRASPKDEPKTEEHQPPSKVSKRTSPTNNYRLTTFTISTSRNFENERKTISKIFKKMILQERANSDLEKWKRVSAEDIDMIFTGAEVNEENGSERSHLYEIKVKCVFCGKYIKANHNSRTNDAQCWSLNNYKVHLLKH